MKNKMSTLILTLTIIGVISALSLAFVYQWTIPRIDEHQQRLTEKAILEVLPGATSYREITKNDHIYYLGLMRQKNR